MFAACAKIQEIARVAQYHMMSYIKRELKGDEIQVTLVTNNTCLLPCILGKLQPSPRIVIIILTLLCMFLCAWLTNFPISFILVTYIFEHWILFNHEFDQKQFFFSVHHHSNKLCILLPSWKQSKLPWLNVIEIEWKRQVIFTTEHGHDITNLHWIVTRILLFNSLYPPLHQNWKRVYLLLFLSPSVHAFVRRSVHLRMQLCLLCIFHNTHWIYFNFSTSYQPTSEGVLPVEFSQNFPKYVRSHQWLLPKPVMWKACHNGDLRSV